ncbi:MAG: hypothetical protein ACKOAH_19400, partial [Pirellula sp.]
MQLQNSAKFDFYLIVRQLRRLGSNSGEHSIPNHFEQLKPHVKSSRRRQRTCLDRFVPCNWINHKHGLSRSISVGRFLNNLSEKSV